MIQFRLHHPATDANRAGHAYASRMAQALTAIGHPARVAPAPSVTCESLVVIDGQLMTTLPIADCAGAVVLLHCPPVSLIGDDPLAPDRAWQERLSVVRQVICTGQATAGWVRATFGVAATVVPPGADPLPATVPPPGPVHILSSGVRMVQEGLDLIAALSRLTDLDWTLTIAGPIAGTTTADTIAGPANRDVAWEGALAAGEPALIDRVTIVRDPDRAALNAYYARAGLFVLLTRAEEYSVEVAEAFSRGVPVVTTAAATADLPLGALQVEATDGATVSKVLRRTLHDAELRHSLADAAARAGAVLPDWPTQAEQFAVALAVKRGA